MSKLLALPVHTHVSALVSVVDLSRFFLTSRRLSPEALAATLDEFYERIAATITADGGVVVKFIGDGALIAFDDGQVNAGVLSLLRLEREIDRWLGGHGLACALVVKVHFGPVVAGPFGAAGNKRFDLVGPTVNTVFSLTARDFAMSEQAYRRLDDKTQALFLHHGPSSTYRLRPEKEPR